MWTNEKDEIRLITHYPEVTSSNYTLTMFFIFKFFKGRKVIISLELGENYFNIERKGRISMRVIRFKNNQAVKVGAVTDTEEICELSAASVLDLFRTK